MQNCNAGTADKKAFPVGTHPARCRKLVDAIDRQM